MTVSRQGWEYEITKGGAKDILGHTLYEVRFWTSLALKRDGLGSHVIDGGRSDLMNNFKMQIRTNHQRVVALPGDITEPAGYTRHVSGLAVPNRTIVDPAELATLLANNSLPLSGYTPFMFANHAGVLEPLDGMWQHEEYALPLLGQAEGGIERYIDRAAAKAWEGDRRGTTLNLQVGASSDDAYWYASGPVLEPTSGFQYLGGFIGGAVIESFARVTAAIGNADTIDTCTATNRSRATSNNNILSKLKFENADNPAAPTTPAEFTSRTLTTGTDYDITATFSNNIEYETVDFAAELQTVVDRGGWSSGNAIILFQKDDGSSFSLAAHSYDSDTAKATKIDIDFTAGAAGTSLVVPHPSYRNMLLRR